MNCSTNRLDPVPAPMMGLLILKSLILQFFLLGNNVLGKFVDESLRSMHSQVRLHNCRSHVLQKAMKRRPLALGRPQLTRAAQKPAPYCAITLAKGLEHLAGAEFPVLVSPHQTGLAVGLGEAKQTNQIIRQAGKLPSKADDCDGIKGRVKLLPIDH